jgi:hypothetical protein
MYIANFYVEELLKENACKGRMTIGDSFGLAL